MDKLFFKKNTIARVEHFGILLLTLDGNRFSFGVKFKEILNHINGSNMNLLINNFSNQLGEKEIRQFINILLKKGIIIYSSSNINSKLKLIENNFITEDCLSFPRTVYRELTQLCNLECIHCYSASMIKGFKGLDFNEIKNTIDELIDRGVEFLNIGGGEPMIYKDIYKTLYYAISKGLTIEMTTNGILINDDSIKKLKKTGIKFIQISLDGSHKNIYEKIRRKSDFNKVISAINKLIEAGFVLSVNTVLMKHNKDDIINIIKLCKNLGVNYFKVSPLMETGRGSSNVLDLQLSLNEYKNIYKNIIKYKQSHLKDDMKIIIYQNILKPDIKNIDWMPDNHYGCPASRTTCGIDSYGNVYPCSYMNHKELCCGNIKEQSLLDIRSKSDIMNKIRNIDKITGKCSNCDFLDLCRGGCRATSYLRYKKLDATDPLCVVNI